MALDQKEELRQRALANQSAGGKLKASSTLTKARRLDVRAEIARIAGASAGSGRKVEDRLKQARPEGVGAGSEGKVSIHSAWPVCEYSAAQQQAALSAWISERALVAFIQSSLANEKMQEGAMNYDLAHLHRCLQHHLSGSLEEVSIQVLDLPGK